jgi:hypothetical protein
MEKIMTNELSKDRVDVIRDIHPFFTIGVIKVTFNSSENSLRICYYS